MEEKKRRVMAKFVVDKLVHYRGGGEVHLSPVVGGSDENENFFKYTPAGECRMVIDNPAALALFQPEKEFYVYFEEAEKTPEPAAPAG